MDNENYQVDVKKGLPRIREQWILDRGDVEVLDGITSEYGKQRLNDEKLDISRQLSEAYQNVTLSRPGWEKEIEEMTSFLPKQPSAKERLDPLFEDAATFVVKYKEGATLMIQRKFSLGYNRAGRIMDELEKNGIIGPQNGSRPREVLIHNETSLKELLNSI